MDKLLYIIDDDPVYLKFMTEHFKRMGGYETRVFEHGDEALEKINEQKPSLIILDNHLQEPNKSGVFYLKHIIKIKPRIPVIYITADTDEELKRQVKHIGVDSYIIKDQSFLVHLRTALDEINNQNARKGFFKRLFG
ncbi:MAG: response regulator [Cyclobacteriaceae bacterium]|jgi:CheY-like chemotaxis protein|nr:response regulator [Cyclobacteriaceae bacterium]